MRSDNADVAGQGEATPLRPAAPLQRVLLACGAVGPPLFVLAFLVEGATRHAGYDPLRYPVSSLAIGPSGWTQTANFLVTGALLLAFSFGLRPAVRRYGGGVWAPLLIGLVSIGLIGAGVFVTDPVNGYPEGTPMVPVKTMSGTLHDLFSALVFLGLPVACLVLAYRFWVSRHRAWAGYSAGTAVAFLGCFVLTSMGFARDPVFMPVGGLLQRLTLAIGWAWLTLLALYLLRRRPPAAPASRP
ncbi:DUF998 domain-containing protein [Sphaerisporangium perillae]|uniref:DUF998 domain-containing protein n=1 Tax=Sphaerisporangium perillae TaxID=2935860 RepID=UPI00200DA6B9|nr:DUF998 domain-containing protein [Sphaerisporangium perillae]